MTTFLGAGQSVAEQVERTTYDNTNWLGRARRIQRGVEQAKELIVIERLEE